MRKRAILFLLVIILLFSSTIFSQAKEDAEYLYIKKQYKINQDGSWTFKYESKVKLYTYLATRRFFGESFIVYNPKYQKLNILKSITTMSDDKKVPTPPNGYNEVLPRAAHYFPSFSFMREMVVSHTGLERGATEEFAYTINTSKDFSPYFFTTEPLKDKVPIKNIELSFEVPSGFKFSYKTINSSIKPVVKKRENKTIYIFQEKNISKNLTNNPEDLPYLYVKVSREGKSILPFFKKNEEIPDKLKKKIDEFKRKSGDFYEFLLKLQKYISSNIQTVWLGVDKTGFHLRNLKKIVSSGYGTPLEKTKLLYSVLNYLGKTPEILIFSPFNYSEGISSLDKFFVSIKVKDKTFFLDPTKLQSEFYPYGYDGWKILSAENKPYKLKTIKGILDNMFKVSGCIDIENKRGMIIFITKGFFNDYRKVTKSERSFASSLLKKYLNINVIKATVSSVTENALKELMKRPELGKALSEQRIAKEIEVVDRMMKEIMKDGNVAYGIKDVKESIEAGAVDVLIVSDRYLMENDIDSLLKKVESMNGKINIITTTHEAGEQLYKMGGIAAMLRFKIK